MILNYSKDYDISNFSYLFTLGSSRRARLNRQNYLARFNSRNDKDYTGAFLNALMSFVYADADKLKSRIKGLYFKNTLGAGCRNRYRIMETALENLMSCGVITDFKLVRNGGEK